MEKNDRKREQQHKNVGKIKRYVQNKYKQKVFAKERKLGRKLTRQEKNEISDDIIKGLGIRVAASVLALGTAIGVGFKMADTKALPEGKGQEIVSEDTNRGKGFRESLVVELSEETQENTIEVPASDIGIQIDNIESKDEALNWLKDLYIDKYEEVTGKDNNLTPASIEIKDKNVSAIYEVANGQYVTQLDSPMATEQMLDAKGLNYKQGVPGRVYMVSIANNGTVVDCADKDANGYHKVIVSEYYQEMEGSESVLAEMGDVLPKTFELIGLYKQLEDYQKENNKYNEFIGNKIENAKESLKGIINEQNKEQPVQDSGVELGD